MTLSTRTALPGALALLPAAALLAHTTFTPSAAHACGGTFCDTGPQAMPVDQTGENILFVMDDNGGVEAHIQVQYQGEAARFAWVIPIPSLPTFGIGSQLLFDELLRASVPSYGLQRQFESCAESDNCIFCSPTAGSGNSASSSSGGGSSGQSGGPQVVLKQTVGAFDVTVIQGGTEMEVMAWLEDNGYAQPPGAQALIRQYTQENHLFAAIKLTGGAGVEEIHPLVLRYTAGVPCVPLRLTAVAAVANMGVRTFFLGQHRTVPRRYHHVEVNPLRIDWLNNGANYTDVLAEAVDDPAAEGRAFVTEFAGASTGINVNAFHGESWSSATLPSSPLLLVDELERQGVMNCSFSGMTCAIRHPLLRALLEEFLPVPEGLTDIAFWGDTQNHEAQVNMAAWNAELFAERYEERVVAPARNARNLVTQNPYLTRMLTFISPDEMTEDPEFHEREDLPDVAAQRIATLTTRCNGSQYLDLPDGRRLELTESGTLPDFSAMPAAELVEDIPATGERTVLASHGAEVNAGLDAWNDTRAGDSGEGGGGCGCRPSQVNAEPALVAAAALAGLWMRRRARR